MGPPLPVSLLCFASAFTSCRAFLVDGAFALIKVEKNPYLSGEAISLIVTTTKKKFIHFDQSHRGSLPVFAFLNSLPSIANGFLYPPGLPFVAFSTPPNSPARVSDSVSLAHHVGSNQIPTQTQDTAEAASALLSSLFSPEFHPGSSKCPSIPQQRRHCRGTRLGRRQEGAGCWQRRPEHWSGWRI